MIANRSSAPGDVFPRLVYDDVGAAARWLCDAFGFVERFRYGPPGEPQGVLLVVGHGAVMLAGARAANPEGEWWERRAFRAPGGHPLSHTIGVRVEGIDAHCACARDRGATILAPPATYPYGERQYSALDPGGHRWDFTESVADVGIAEWGGQPGPAAP